MEGQPKSDATAFREIQDMDDSQILSPVLSPQDIINNSLDDAQKMRTMMWALKEGINDRKQLWEKIIQDEEMFYDKVADSVNTWIEIRKERIIQRRKHIKANIEEEEIALVEVEYNLDVERKNIENKAKNMDDPGTQSVEDVAASMSIVKEKIEYTQTSMKKIDDLLKTLRKSQNKERKIIHERIKGMIDYEMNMEYEGQLNVEVTTNLRALLIARRWGRKLLKKAQHNLREKKRLHLADERSNKIHTWDLSEGRSITIELSGEVTIPTGCDTIEVGHKIFIIGGIREYPDYLMETWAINEKERKLVLKAFMMVEKAHHSLVAFGSTLIFSIGGENTSGWLDIVERFNVRTNEWHMMPPLQQRKSQVAACKFGSRFIYAFGGQLGLACMNSIEVFDIETDTIGWELLEVKNQQIWTAKQAPGAVQISPKFILIFGGSPSKKTYILNTYENVMQIHPSDTLKYESFQQRKPIIYMNKIYIFGRKFRDIHIVDPKYLACTWNLISHNDWLKTEY